MAGVKQAGLASAFWIDGWDLSGDVNALSSVHGGPAALDVTGISESAYERIGGQRSGEMSFTTLWDTGSLTGGTTGEHAALAPLPYTDRISVFAPGPVALSSPAACLNGRQLNDDWTRATDGSLQGAVDVQSDGFGLEWGVMLTPGIRTDTTATAAGPGNSINQGAASSFGAQAYLEVFSVTGTSVTVTIWDSADNVTFAAVAGFAFAATVAGTPPAVPSQRIAISNSSTLRQYVAVATTGTFSNAQFAVVLVRNPVAGQVF